MVEPDNNPGEGSRSWIIYVLGGSYPENHPILTTPSLFTDSPTYEDMMLLSSILGPAKPPVASEEDVASAPGLLRIRDHGGTLVAEPVEGDETVALVPGARCLVCLCDFEAKETARRLVKCGHVFHEECIDHVSFLSFNACVRRANSLAVADPRPKLLSSLPWSGCEREGKGNHHGNRDSRRSCTCTGISTGGGDSISSR